MSLPLPPSTAEGEVSGNGCSEYNGDGSGGGGGRSNVNGRCKGCVEMNVVVFKGNSGTEHGSSGCAAMSANDGGVNGVFSLAMMSSGCPHPRLRQRAMAMAAMGKASEVLRVRARMGHC